MKKVQTEEIVGINICVIESPNKELIGVSGKVIDETKNTLRIKTKVRGTTEKIITLVKDQCVFKFDIKNKEVIINGKCLAGRPEERIKKYNS